MKKQMIETVTLSNYFGRVSYIGDYAEDLQKKLINRYGILISNVLFVSEKTVLGIRFCEIIYKGRFNIDLEREGLFKETKDGYVKKCSSSITLDL